MPVSDTLALQLRALGSGFVLPESHALLQPLLAQQPRAGVQRQADLPYGAHARQRLDVYAPQAPGSGRPVLVFLHGGGFVRGDKSARENLGLFFARHGIVTLLPNYRLAPQARWPAGPQDVAAVLRWLQAEVAHWGGDARRVVLAGESAGAAHVAAAVLGTRFGLRPGLDFQAAALLSGPYDARLEGLARRPLGIETPDPRNEAYFGPTPADWAAGSIVDLIDAPPFPLLISFAERDLLQMQVQAGELFAHLVREHGFMPELHCVRDHNHFSQTVAINTSADELGPLLLRAIERWV